MMENIPSGHADVFLSYSHDDRELVEKIAGLISAADFSCWIDKERLRAAEKFNSSIDIAIDDSIVFVAFLSKTYVNKPYCIHEFDLAIQREKSIVAVCLDDVSESANRQSAYMFSFCAGHDVLGFGSGINESSDGIASFAREITESVPLTQLKRFLCSGDEKDLPPIDTPEYLIDRLRLYHEHQYEQSGNYALNEIRSELFPAIKNPEINILYKDDQKKDVSLVKFFSETDGQDDLHKHLLITGEGGMGKTVSLLKTCDYLLSKRINAIYVPLSKIDASMTLDQYLARIVCGGNQSMWGVLRNLMSVPYTSAPNVVLLLDGINEISLDYVKTFVNKLNTEYIIAYSGIRIIMTSRWFDASLLHCLMGNVVSLEMQTLDRESIELYLHNMGLPPVTDEKVFAVIRTPLMLTLFSDVEKHRSKYQYIKGIALEEHPDTAGKILSNFFQTQLYRAAEEDNFDQAAHLVLLEYLLPALAFKMLEKQRLYLSEDEILRSIGEIDKNCDRYTWYKKDTLCRLLRGRSRFDTEILVGLATDSLHFLHESDAGYEFLHQSFRDYFAAFHIANEMKAFAYDPDRLDDVEPVLQQTIYPNDILGFVSDILREENARPVRTEDGWNFPGKTTISAPEKSVAEQLLSLWRTKNGDLAQNAVSNLIDIMKIGRKGLLAWCDFSDLDLRKCWLNKCVFTVWYRDAYYPSLFDRAWIDRANFLTDGHEAPISAVAADSHAHVFSGDEAGVVKIYSLAEQSYLDTIQLQSSPVVDLALDHSGELLAILYENIVFCYSIATKSVVKSYGNDSRSKSFRYVQFSKENELNVSFDLEPLIWCDVHGQKLPSGLPYDIPARCARWNPQRQEFARSNLLQLFSVTRFDEDTHSWKLQTFFKNSSEDTIPHKGGDREFDPSRFQSLRDVGALGAGGICCIQYRADGTRVLVTIENLLVEYDTESFDVLNRKTFSSNVRCACYRENGIAVGVGSHLVLLDPDFSEEKVLRGSQINSIRRVLEDYKSDGYYVLSSTGEIKRLNHELVVQDMRYTGITGRFVWVRDRLTDDIQMAFLPLKRFPYGARYTYETDQFEPLGWRYEFLDIPTDNDEDAQRFYTMDSSLMVIERLPSYRKIEYTNYTGIWIFRCSFDEIQGNMTDHKNISFLIQNGGIIHDVSE